MEFAYYLPEVLFGILALVAVIWIGKVVWELFWVARGKGFCIYCKGIAEREPGTSCLFLLPIHFGDTYEDAEEYLRTHMVPIESKEQIPTGMRACRMEIYRCNKCDKRQVEITDFLYVRGDESVKGSYEFPYEPFQPLVEQWKDLAFLSASKRGTDGQLHGEAVSIIKRRGVL